MTLGHSPSLNITLTPLCLVRVTASSHPSQLWPVHHLHGSTRIQPLFETTPLRTAALALLLGLYCTFLCTSSWPQTPPFCLYPSPRPRPRHATEPFNDVGENPLPHSLPAGRRNSPDCMFLLWWSWSLEIPPFFEYPPKIRAGGFLDLLLLFFRYSFNPACSHAADG
jgi:hypothetical protein